jgi:hypothetical protein
LAARVKKNFSGGKFIEISHKQATKLRWTRSATFTPLRRAKQKRAWHFLHPVTMDGEAG